MKTAGRVLGMMLCFVICCSGAGFGEEIPYSNPLLNPKELEYIETPAEMINILLLGIDFGTGGYLGSGGRRSLEDCHTDAVLVVTVHVKEQRVDMVSLPRDTLTYIPGVRGIYKLNAAINCGEDIQGGLQKTCDAASWVLGGVKIDYYCAVDMTTMIALGDAIGGVDFDMDMTYIGHSGTRYRKGPQHLNGTGIIDYFRARTNATARGNDIGRTGRHRDLMAEIFQKFKSQPALLLSALDLVGDYPAGFFTNMTMEDMIALLPIALKLNLENLGSYVMTGPYRAALMDWNFTFTNQENRQAVIKEVYGIDVPPLAYVDFEYTKWLVDTGFTTIHLLSVADELKAHIAGLNQATLTPADQAAVQTFLDAYLKTADAFEKAAISMSSPDDRAMAVARNDLKEQGQALEKVLRYPEKLPWYSGKYWYADPYINEVQLDWK